METPILDNDNVPVLFRRTSHGKVHVLVKGAAWDNSFVAGLYSRLVALCGVQGNCGDRQYVERFRDEQLCTTCVKRLSDELREALFTKGE